MKLYLIRHTTASDSAANDFERKLTPRGENEARLVGAALAKEGVRPTRVFASPLVRARQTAEIVAREVSFAGPVEAIDELKNDSPPQALIRVLGSCPFDAKIVLVGHMPSLAGYVAALTGAKNADEFAFGKGSVAAVGMAAVKLGSARLDWMLHLSELGRTG